MFDSLVGQDQVCSKKSKNRKEYKTMEIYEVEETNKGGGVLIVIMIIGGLFTCSCGLLAALLL